MSKTRAAAFIKNHPKTKFEDFRTPEYLIKWINSKYGPIDFDAACVDGVNNLFTALRLEEEWPVGSTVYSNPPFDVTSLIKWFKKGLKHAKSGGVHIMIVPNKICQKSFVENINPHFEKVVFLGGRINFEGPHIVKGGTSRNGCMLLINGLNKNVELTSINLCDIKALFYSNVNKEVEGGVEYVD